MLLMDVTPPAAKEFIALIADLGVAPRTEANGEFTGRRALFAARLFVPLGLACRLLILAPIW